MCPSLAPPPPETPDVVEAELRARGVDLADWAGDHGVTRAEVRAMLAGGGPHRPAVMRALADALGVSLRSLCAFVGRAAA